MSKTGSTEILALIGEGRKTTAEIVERVGPDSNRGNLVSSTLSRLKAIGRIVNDGKGTPWRLAAPAAKASRTKPRTMRDVVAKPRGAATRRAFGQDLVEQLEAEADKYEERARILRDTVKALTA